jgi:hypothetical protein
MGVKLVPCDPTTPLGGDDLALDALACAYDEAVCRDANAAGSGDESLSSALELLARITIHVPHLMVLMTALEDTEDADAHACLAREARRQSAGVLRLGQRALEVHARDVGYAASTWRENTIAQAGVALSDANGREAGDELGQAMRALDEASCSLAAAITALPADRMDVPAHLAGAQGGWLPCYVRARHHAADGHP